MVEWEWLSLGAFAVFSLAVAALSYATTKARADLLGAAFMLFLTWPLTLMVNLVLDPPQSMLIGPVLDAAFAAALLASVRHHYQAWKLVLLGLLVLQAFFHVIYQSASASEWALYPYIVELNITYALQLACVSITGGRDVVLHYRRYGLRGFRDRNLLDGAQ